MSGPDKTIYVTRRVRIFGKDTHSWATIDVSPDLKTSEHNSKIDLAECEHGEEIFIDEYQLVRTVKQVKP